MMLSSNDKSTPTSQNVQTEVISSDIATSSILAALPPFWLWLNDEEAAKSRPKSVPKYVNGSIYVGGDCEHIRRSAKVVTNLISNPVTNNNKSIVVQEDDGLGGFSQANSERILQLHPLQEHFKYWKEITTNGRITIIFSRGIGDKGDWKIRYGRPAQIKL